MEIKDPWRLTRFFPFRVIFLFVQATYALIYSSLWRGQIFGKLKNNFPGPTNFLLDQPPENIVSLYKAIQEYGSMY